LGAGRHFFGHIYDSSVIGTLIGRRILDVKSKNPKKPNSN
jgi:hypothetical protein